MKKITTLIVAMTLCMASAKGQTARQVTLDISGDGESTLQVFLPNSPTGIAIVDCPGGGYTHLSMQNEGTDWANYFNAQGVVFCVLKYRMPHGDRAIPMGDAERAIKTVRDSADAWHIDVHKVGIMGFSAGGHLASTIATHSDSSVRPNFQILFYPVISMDERLTHKGSVEGFLGEKKSYPKLVELYSNDKQVRKGETPKAFLAMAGDDKAVPVATNGLPYYESLLRQGVPASLHIYPKGGHGFGFRSTFAYHDQMLSELASWLKGL